VKVTLQTHAKQKSAQINWGLSNLVRHAQTQGENLHRHAV
jgi:hypothetical protein